MRVQVFNPGRGPVLLDEAGHTLGAGEWSPADDSDEQTSHDLKVGLLVRSPSSAEASE